MTRRYRIRHRTEYRYGEPVALGHTVARLVPRAGLPRQTLVSAAVTAEPTPTHAHEHVDGFGNVLTYVTVEEPHDLLVVEAALEVEVAGPSEPGDAWRRPWEDAVAATGADPSDDGLLARLCRLDSPHVARHPNLRDLAAASFAPGRPLGEAAAELTGRIHAGFEFLPGVTDVSTPVLQVLAERRGVCQDFAHLLLGALRSLGLGAHYVSGYLETEPPPGQPRLTGADASHAWVGLRLPGDGWVDLDPTNGLVQPDRHVTVGWGRDYSDVAPVRGVVFGPPAQQELSVSVDVVPIL
jgi:transglutaminase-like putative cysteine protease